MNLFACTNEKLPNSPNAAISPLHFDIHRQWASDWLVGVKRKRFAEQEFSHPIGRFRSLGGFEDNELPEPYAKRYKANNFNRSQLVAKNSAEFMKEKWRTDCNLEKLRSFVEQSSQEMQRRTGNNSYHHSMTLLATATSSLANKHTHLPASNSHQSSICRLSTSTSQLIDLGPSPLSDDDDSQLGEESPSSQLFSSSTSPADVRLPSVSSMMSDSSSTADSLLSDWFDPSNRFDDVFESSLSSSLACLSNTATYTSFAGNAEKNDFLWIKQAEEFISDCYYFA